MKTTERPYNDPVLREAMKQDTGEASMQTKELELRVMNRIKDTRHESIGTARPQRLIIYKIAAVFIGLLVLSGIGYVIFQHIGKTEQKQEIAITEHESDVKEVSDLGNKSLDSLGTANNQEPVHQILKAKIVSSHRHSKQPSPEPSEAMPDIDISAEVADILANIDQLEQQILLSNPQNSN